MSFYDQADAPFFFGRERETQIVSAHIIASRLTVLYGESGVGKSSLLRAGAARHLMTIARENVARRGTPRHVVAVFPTDEGEARTTWREDPLPAILGAVEGAVASLGLEIPAPNSAGDLCAQLADWTARLGSDLVIVLDQFEEYLLYHHGEDGAGTLFYELPRAVTQTNLRANFLISIREDMLARLDSFKRSLPTIFDNCVRVNHLDREDARAAIVKPLDTYNELRSAGDHVSIELPLVDTLLDELEAGRVVVGLSGAGISDEGPLSGDHPVETPYLQLVMTRLWKEEMDSGSPVLRLATLERLGHSEHIVKTHLDGTMRALPRYARFVAARAFHHLVTPSGSKIAHSPSDLAAYTGLDVEDIEPVLERLSQPEHRILRRVARSTAEDAPARFEIFHDVLGTPILDWRTRYLRTREVGQVVRNGVTGFVLILFGIVCIVSLIVLIVAGAHSPSDALWIAWAISALLMWLSTTLVLVSRWDRREAWAVPLVGIAAAAIGPVTGLAFAVNGAFRLTGHWRRATFDVRPGGGVRRFAGFVALSGAAVLILASLLPAAGVEIYDSNDNYRSANAHVIDSGGQIWFALVPLVCVAAAVAVGLLSLVRPRPRPVALGLLSGLGISTLAYFLSLLFWTDAFKPFFEHGGTQVGYTELRGALFLGIGGAGLVLVSGAPLVVVEIFAAIVGAQRLARGDTREGYPMRLDSSRSTAQLRVALLGVLGAAAGFAATLVDSGAWERARSDSLYEVSFWAGFQATFPCAAAAAASAVILFGNGVSKRAAGCLAGCGVVLIALFAGTIGSLHGHSPPGAYIGIGAGVVLTLAGVMGFAARTR